MGHRTLSKKPVRLYRFDGGNWMSWVLSRYFVSNVFTLCASFRKDLVSY